MQESVYRVIRVVGSSPTSWEDAAQKAIATTGRTMRGLRVAEVEAFDLKIEAGKPAAYRVRLSLSFKYEEEH